MKNYDFSDFLKSIKHFDRRDKVQTAKMKLIELEKVKGGPSRAEAALMTEKVRELLGILA